LRKAKPTKVEYEFQITTRKRYVSIDEAKGVLRRAGRRMTPARDIR
jgi:biotin synthase